MVVGEVDVVDGAGGADEDEQPAASSNETAKSAGTARVRMGEVITFYESGSASGSSSASVRNMKKNTTQPMAAMKIQLTIR